MKENWPYDFVQYNSDFPMIWKRTDLHSAPLTAKRATTVKKISEVLESFGLTINTLEIGDEITTYSIEVLK